MSLKNRAQMMVTQTVEVLQQDRPTAKPKESDILSYHNTAQHYVSPEGDYGMDISMTTGTHLSIFPHNEDGFHANKTVRL